MEVRLIHRRLLLEDRLLFDWCLAIADINAEIAPARSDRSSYFAKGLAWS
jgi:hypothetical protein